MVCGGDSVRMPSSTSPMLEKTPIAVIDTQPDICASRVAISPAVAMSPAVAAPRVHRTSVPPISTTGSTPASAISQKRKAAEVVPKSIVAPR